MSNENISHIVPSESWINESQDPVHLMQMSRHLLTASLVPVFLQALEELQTEGVSTLLAVVGQTIAPENEAPMTNITLNVHILEADMHLHQVRLRMQEIRGRQSSEQGQS